MGKRQIAGVAVAVLVAVLLLAGAAWILLPRRSGKVAIEVSGTVGTRFQGWCEVDGKRRDWSGAAPATFHLEGHKVVYSVTPAEESGAFSVAFNISGQGPGSVASGRPPHGVHGWVQFGHFSPSFWIEGFEPNGPERWRVPPP
jgi:hypothetical protein